MVVNMNMHSSKEGSINEYLCDTIASVFPQVYTAVLERGTNIELFASMNPDMLAAFDQGRASISDPDLAAMMEQVSGRLTPVKGGNRILTDDKAPVELLGMKVIDELIADELQYYKEMIKSGDWEAL